MASVELRKEGFGSDGHKGHKRHRDTETDRPTNRPTDKQENYQTERHTDDQDAAKRSPK